MGRHGHTPDTAMAAYVMRAGTTRRTPRATPQPTRKRSPLTTTQRGYGAAHKQARNSALARLSDGEPCHLCGRPMYQSQQLHLDHTADRTTYRGLAHAHCNEADGARRGNTMRRPPPMPYSRTW